MLKCKNTLRMAGLVGAGVVIGAMGMGVVASQPEGEMDFEAMMQAWMELHQPNDHHKALHGMGGDWQIVMNDLRSGATYNGSQRDEMGMDGRFLLSQVEMDLGGRPFEGLGCLGYDNVSKKYVSAWIDNTSSGIVTHEGTASSDGKTISLMGEYSMSDGSKSASKHVYHFDGDTRKLEFYEGAIGGEMQKTGVITYTRK